MQKGIIIVLSHKKKLSTPSCCCGSVTMNPRRTKHSTLSRPFALSLLLLLSVSTAKSFQPFLSPAPSCSNDFRSRKTQNPQIKHSHSLQPLRVSATTTSASAAQFLSDWATKVIPVSTTSTTRPANNKEAVAYKLRKAEWATRYTNLESLRETFGSNQNKLWGDLDAGTARRLYRYLMPRALLELVKVGIQPEDLAPLAYQARVAAKLYARERSVVPARVAATLYDGIRQFQRYGKFQCHGMTYDQVWEKYHKVIMDDTDNHLYDDLTEQDVTAKICLKILERSCSTNENIDRWVLPADDETQRDDLSRIADTLEMDVRRLLDAYGEDEPQKTLSLRKYRTLRLVASARAKARRNFDNRRSPRSPTESQI